MKNKLLILIFALVFTSCAVKTFTVDPDQFTMEKPELNQVSEAEIGISLVSKEIGLKYNAIQITKGKTVKPGIKTKEIKEGEIFIYNSYTNDYDLYSNLLNEQSGIAIPKNNSAPRTFSKFGGLSIVRIKEVIEYKNIIYRVPSKEYFKQEFIYNGRVGNALKFIYREFIDDIARPAFTQDLQYDLSENNIIGFRGLRIEVLNATNTNIRYKILNQFNK